MNGRVATRFEVVHDVEGLITTTPTRREAMTIAEEWASGNTGYPDAIHEVRVFDSMAYPGRINTWAIRHGVWAKAPPATAGK